MKTTSCAHVLPLHKPRERQGRLALDRRGKHAGRVEPTKTHAIALGILGDPDFGKFSSYSIIFSKPHFALQDFFNATGHL